MGRKKKKPSDVRNKYIRVMLKPSEFAEIQRVSMREAQEGSAWIRSKIMELIRNGNNVANAQK